MKCLLIPIPHKACVVKLLIMLNQRSITPLYLLMFLIAPYFTFLGYREILPTEENLKLRTPGLMKCNLFPQTRERCLLPPADTCIKSCVKRYSNTTSSGIRNESDMSITGQILDSPPAAHSTPLQATTMLLSFMKQFEGSPS